MRIGINTWAIGAVVGASTCGAIGQCADCPVGQSGEIKVVRMGDGGFGAPETLLCVAAGTDFTIDLGSWTWASDDWIIHVYDCASPPTHDIGRVTIAGDPAGIDSLGVFVADENQFWDEFGGSLLFAGCVDFGGLEISDADVRAKTRASIAVDGDITPVTVSQPPADIHVNQIIRIQAEGLTDPVTGQVTGGNIDGDLIAEGGTLFDPSQQAIQEVRAWNAIRGTIEAKDGDIFAVRIVGDPDDPNGTPPPEGITGDILAKKGKINIIYTTGPIGNAATGVKPKIQAGREIDEIRAIDPANVDQFGNPLVIPANFSADVLANQLIIDDPTSFPYADSREDGTLHLLETAGDFSGSITAGNIAGGSLGHDRRVPRYGIFVRGDLAADINVTFNLHYANIVAGRISGDVAIGRLAKGAIVAVGREDDPTTAGLDETLAGHIDSVDIGNAVLTAQQSLYAAFTPGLVGISCEQQLTMEPDYWFGSGAFEYCVDGGSWLDGNPFGGAALDGAVRAVDSIGSVDIRRMTQLHFSDPPSFADVKTSVPRIEAPVIGSLKIDDMREGVVWSGIIDDGEAGFYAHVNELEVGCLGPAADLWFQDCPLADINADVLGEIHVPALAADETIRIGGSLKAWPAGGFPSYYDSIAVDDLACGVQNYAFGASSEASPRDTTWPDEDNRRAGAVRLLNSGSLSGQIIINGHGEFAVGQGWEGWVIIGDNLPFANPPTGQIVLKPSGVQPDQAPYYDRTSAELGGGAVGLVPYKLHGADCIPARNPITPPEFLNSYWIEGPGTPGLDEIRLRHYGPVFGLGDPLTIELVSEPPFDPDPVDLTDQFTVQLHQNDASLGRREIRISQNGMRPIGNFSVTVNDLFCDSVNAPLVTVAAYQYPFRMLSDCNDDHVDDATQLSPSTDANSDGTLDACQLGMCDCDLAPPGTTPPVDVDVFDLLAYMDLWFSMDAAAERTGDSPADITVLDLLDYLDCWFPHNGGVC